MTISPELATRIEVIAGSRVASHGPLSGGCVGQVYRIRLACGDTLVAKVGFAGSGLDVEGDMLRYLKDNSDLPVPEVLSSDELLLLMTWIEAGDPIDAASEHHAAEVIAALHGITADHYGLAWDTRIGGLPQPNRPSADWITFFRDQRLLHMGRKAVQAGRMPGRVLDRLEKLSGNLESLIGPPSSPSLIHGDLWTGNVLIHRSRIAGFVDPAIYYADPEIELAFSTLFSTFGKAFFRRYHELRPIRPDFFDTRRDLYNLYPLLVHVRLFGGGYLASVERILTRFGA
ncbi:MAG: fructosamine kinase family protein [Alphaproteobacteria bacterium]